MKPLTPPFTDASSPAAFWRSPTGIALAELYRAKAAELQATYQQLTHMKQVVLIIAGMALLASFSIPHQHYLIIPLNTVLISVLLIYDARLYRECQLWHTRLDWLAAYGQVLYMSWIQPALRPQATLITHYLTHTQPAPAITWRQAFGQRFWEHYWLLFLVLEVGWLSKTAFWPTQVTNWAEFVAHATTGPLSGPVMLLIEIGYTALLFLVAVSNFHARTTPRHTTF